MGQLFSRAWVIKVARAEWAQLHQAQQPLHTSETNDLHSSGVSTFAPTRSELTLMHRTHNFHNLFINQMIEQRRNGRQAVIVRSRTVPLSCGNDVRQLDGGIPLDIIFNGKNILKAHKRPKLEKCLAHGHMDRLARNLKDFQNIVDDLLGQGASIKSHKHNLVFSSEANTMGKLLFQVMGVFAEFERSLSKKDSVEALRHPDSQLNLLILKKT